MLAVVYAGSDGDSSAETVQAAADAIRQCFGASLAALLVITGDNAHQLSRVTGVSGFVVGASCTNYETARSMFLCLAMLTAPKTLNGIDFADLLPILGTASEPTVLADALWLREGEGRLFFASADDASAVRSSDRVLAVPLIGGAWGWSELHRFYAAVRIEAIASDELVFFGADEAIASSIFPTGVANVPILCSRR